MYIAQTTLRNTAIIERLSIDGVLNAKREKDAYDVTRYLHVIRQHIRSYLVPSPYLARAKPVPRSCQDCDLINNRAEINDHTAVFVFPRNTDHNAQDNAQYHPSASGVQTLVTTTPPSAGREYTGLDQACDAHLVFEPALGHAVLIMKACRSSLALHAAAAVARWSSKLE